ncbi:hypothetical protein [Tenacibaculum soleae]|uniref:hypothetical protein n=1 Tax=Tenacibaculum soleae TaxID=447689 RepID=UPI0023003431|nr:hypothetical protein [Tenacibaculum soleae]
MTKVILNLDKVNNNNLPTFSKWWKINKSFYKNKVSKKIAKDIWGASNDAVLIVLEQAGS